MEQNINKSILSGSMLWLHPEKVIPSEWLINDEQCVEYLKRFEIPVSLPFWFVNSMTAATELLREALEKNRRRWILECGPWASNPPIEYFSDLILNAGHSLETISLINSANIWLDPVEWIDRR